ncbi:MAG: hypothetical protein IJL20_01860 [Lachnospiraceae bacterium]|nr:hypothetical protein [Lachnospiraceae bacterium]
MSAIFGLINKVPFSFDETPELLGMQVWNNPYGRESSDVKKGGNFFVGCCLDKINQYISTGNPIITAPNYYCVVDAIIYNRDELLNICKLPNIISDSELLISYIQLKGLDFLSQINGEFAGAIYYPDKQELILFRDHMGIRPLFYYINDDFVSFSTDIRGITGLLRANITLDELWIYKTLNGFIPTELTNTEYTNVFCVKPGSYLRIPFSNNIIGAPQIISYWELGKNKIRLRSDLEYQSRLKDLITDSVKRRLDVLSGTVGAELSGGLDSGIISILINKLKRDGVYYSWSYSPEMLPYAEKDERLIIKDICDQEKITCTFKQQTADLKEPLLDYLNLVGLKPTDNSMYVDYAYPAYINTTNITETALYMKHSGVKVVFSGHGGDEGVSHRANPYEMWYNHEHYHYLRYMWSQTKGQKHRFFTTFKDIKKSFHDNKELLSASFVGPFKAPELINQSFHEKMKSFKAPVSYFAYDTIKHIMHGGSRNRLDNIALQGACCDVRYICPYLDYRVIDFAVSIPRYQYLRGRRNRYIFREAFKDIMPQSLYKVVDKDDNSRKNLKLNPNWHEDYLKIKSTTVSRLHKNVWASYLDFDKLSLFLNKTEVTEQEAGQDYKIIQALTQCIMAQNALEKSREISKEITNKHI